MILSVLSGCSFVLRLLVWSSGDCYRLESKEGWCETCERVCWPCPVRVVGY